MNRKEYRYPTVTKPDDWYYMPKNTHQPYSTKTLATVNDTNTNLFFKKSFRKYFVCNLIFVAFNINWLLFVKKLEQNRIVYSFQILTINQTLCLSFRKEHNKSFSARRHFAREKQFAVDTNRRSSFLNQFSSFVELQK